MHDGRHLDQLIAAGAALLFLIFGSTATSSLAGQSRQLLEPKAGTAQSAVIRSGAPGGPEQSRPHPAGSA